MCVWASSHLNLIHWHDRIAKRLYWPYMEGNRFLAMGLFTTLQYGQPVLLVSSGEVELRAALCLAGCVPLCCPTWLVFLLWLSGLAWKSDTTNWVVVCKEHRHNVLYLILAVAILHPVLLLTIKSKLPSRAIWLFKNPGQECEVLTVQSPQPEEIKYLSPLLSTSVTSLIATFLITHTYDSAQSHSDMSFGKLHALEGKKRGSHLTIVSQWIA